MDLNFVGVELVRFRLPRAGLHRAGLKRPLEAHTERQGAVMLMRKRDQAGVTKHEPNYPPLPKPPLPKPPLPKPLTC